MRIHLACTTVLTLALLLTTFLQLTNPKEALAQQAAGGADAAQMAGKMANMTRDWLNGKLSTAGMSGELREVERSKQNGQLRVRYNISVKGAPNDQTYALYSWPINAAKPLEQMKGLSIGADGTIVCAGKTPDQCTGDKENDPVDFVVSPAKGEIFRMALISGDGAAKIFVAAVPEPIVEKNNSCSLEVVRLMPKFELILMRGKGFVQTKSCFSRQSRTTSPTKNRRAPIAMALIF